jgi:hypothetical protein
MKFECYFEDETLRKEVTPWLSYIPLIFGIEVKDGKPELDYCWPDDPNWCDFPFPTKENTLYIFWGDGLISRFAGGGMGKKASLKVWRNDLLTPYDREKVALRIWHELLHAVHQKLHVDEPWADDMKKSDWLDGAIDCWKNDFLHNNVDSNYWHRQYYMYLTRNLIEL